MNRFQLQCSYYFFFQACILTELLGDGELLRLLCMLLWWFWQAKLCLACCNGQFDQLLWTCHYCSISLHFSNADCSSYLQYDTGSPFQSPHLIAVTLWTILVTWLRQWVKSPAVSARHAPVISGMVSHVSQHFLQISLVIVQILQKYMWCNYFNYCY
jgi:hypothetical protein